MGTNVMNQGEDYEEDMTDEEYDEEGEEDVDSGSGKIMGIPVKILAIGGAIIVVIILFVIIFFVRSASKKKSNDDIVLPEASTGQTVYYEPPAEVNPPAATGGITWYTETGQVYGTSDSSEIGATITMSDGGIATVTADGETTIYGDNGAVAQVTGGAVSVGGSSEEFLADTDENRLTLMKLGYTGDEIDLAISNGLNLQQLMDEATALRDEEAKEALIRMSDEASDEFKHLLEYSIFSLPYQEYVHVEDLIGYTYKQQEFIVNADYEKVETYGYQLLLKVKIANGTYAYMTMTPDRWATLPDTGNIVVKVNYILAGDETAVNFYIVKLEEVDVTKITVNPEDSASELTTIIGVDEGSAQ